MNDIVVVYESKYGSTEKYAKWIAKESKADLFKKSEIEIGKLMEYDTIIYGGGLYASGIAGISIIAKNYEKLKDKKIIIFTVGLASTDKEEIFIPIIEKNLSKDMRENIKFFHLRGGINYKQLGIIHKSMMWMLKLIISRKNKEELSNDDIELLDTYGKKVDFTDKNTLTPLLSYLNS